MKTEKTTHENPVIKEKNGKRKVSISYTIKAFGENAKKLHDNKIITPEQMKTLEEIQKTAVENYMKQQFSIF